MRKKSSVVKSEADVSEIRSINGEVGYMAVVHQTSTRVAFEAFAGNCYVPEASAPAQRVLPAVPKHRARCTAGGPNRQLSGGSRRRGFPSWRVAARRGDGATVVPRAIDHLGASPAYIQQHGAPESLAALQAPVQLVSESGASLSLTARNADRQAPVDSNRSPAYARMTTCACASASGCTPLI
jgi:hypothetical protein